MKSHEAVCLVVDDEPDSCWALEHILRKNGWETRCAMRAEQALEAVRATRFAIALLDAKLADMDGLELARRIRAVAPGICIIVVSGYFDQDDAVIRQAKASGVVQQFVGKPFLNEQIVRAVCTSLRARRDSIGCGSGAMNPVLYSRRDGKVTMLKVAKRNNIKMRRPILGLATRLLLLIAALEQGAVVESE